MKTIIKIDEELEEMNKVVKQLSKLAKIKRKDTNY